MNFCPIPQGFRRFLFEPEKNLQGCPRGQPPGKPMISALFCLGLAELV